VTPSGGSLHFWVVAGMVSGAARFLPVPFVDDIVRDQCRRLVVSRTLAAHGTNIQTKDLKSYYASDGGCLVGCVGLAAKVPLKLLLFPIRKVVAIVTSVRGVPLEIVRMVLLGRTLDRYLREKRLQTGEIPSVAMREAFDDSFSRMDFRMVRAAMNDALASVGGWKTAAMDFARKAANGRDTESEDWKTSAEVNDGARRIEAILERPEMLTLFADFDQRFDAAMRERSG